MSLSRHTPYTLWGIREPVQPHNETLGIPWRLRKCRVRILLRSPALLIELGVKPNGISPIDFGAFSA